MFIWIRGIWMNNGILKNNTNVIFVNNNDKVKFFKVNIERDINCMGFLKRTDINIFHNSHRPPYTAHKFRI